jgi:hypothetical protein
VNMQRMSWPASTALAIGNIGKRPDATTVGAAAECGPWDGNGWPSVSSDHSRSRGDRDYDAVRGPEVLHQE